MSSVKRGRKKSSAKIEQRNTLSNYFDISSEQIVGPIVGDIVSNSVTDPIVIVTDILNDIVGSAVAHVASSETERKKKPPVHTGVKLSPKTIKDIRQKNFPGLL